MTLKPGSRIFTMMKSKNNFPKGWDDKRVRRVLRHYESQSDLDAAKEDDAVRDFAARELVVG